MTHFSPRYSDFLPEQNASVHKYTRGRVAIVGGSIEYPGAAILAARSAARAGAGYVNLFVASEIRQLCQASLPSAVVNLMGENSYSTIAKANCIVAGPGLADTADTANNNQKLLEGLLEIDVPLVIDAELLKLMPGISKKHVLTGRTEPVILTPHRGELKEMLKNMQGINLEKNLNDCSKKEIANLCQAWIEDNDATNVVIVAKGEKTIVVGNDYYFEPACGTDTLATAGSGDVLAGTIGGMFSQTDFDSVKKKDRPYFVASVCAACVEVHALAGLLAAIEFGHRGAMASDIADYIGPANDNLYSTTK